MESKLSTGFLAPHQIRPGFRFRQSVGSSLETVEVVKVLSGNAWCIVLSRCFETFGGDTGEKIRAERGPWLVFERADLAGSVGSQWRLDALRAAEDLADSDPADLLLGKYLVRPDWGVTGPAVWPTGPKVPVGEASPIRRLHGSNCLCSAAAMAGAAPQKGDGQ